MKNWKMNSNVRWKKTRSLKNSQERNATHAIPAGAQRATRGARVREQIGKCDALVERSEFAPRTANPNCGALRKTNGATARHCASFGPAGPDQHSRASAVAQSNSGSQRNSDFDAAPQNSGYARRIPPGSASSRFPRPCPVARVNAMPTAPNVNSGQIADRGSGAFSAKNSADVLQRMPLAANSAGGMGRTVNPPRKLPRRLAHFSHSNEPLSLFAQHWNAEASGSPNARRERQSPNLLRPPLKVQCSLHEKNQFVSPFPNLMKNCWRLLQPVELARASPNSAPNCSALLTPIAKPPASFHGPPGAREIFAREFL